MRLSRGCFSTMRERISDGTLAQQILMQSGQLKQYASGIYGKNNFLVKAQTNIENIIREILESYDCIEVEFPLLQPKSIWDSSGRFDSYHASGQMFHCDMPNGTFCMAPTAEEAAIEFVRDKLKSYRDLPINLYQIGSKFRNELRSRGGLLRSKEFIMMDAYSFHASQESLQEEYDRMRSAYLEIFSQLGLKVVPVKALNGDMGGNYSEEFMYISNSGEDTMLVNDDFSMAFNTELLQMENATEYLKNTYGINTNLNEFHIERCIELGHIFQLGQRYSKSMHSYFTNSKNEKIPHFMGCYGIGISRLLAAICETNCDSDGIIWPESIVPYTTYIVYTDNRQTVANELYDELLHHGVKVVIDDRPNLSFGAKLKDAKLFGFPYIVIIGNNYQDNLIFEVEISQFPGKLYPMMSEELKVLEKSLGILKNSQKIMMQRK